MCLGGDYEPTLRHLFFAEIYMNPSQPHARLTALLVGAAAIVVGLAVVVASGIIGLSRTMIGIGVLFAAWALYGILHPDTTLAINTFYLAGIQSRETAIRWATVEAWLVLFASIAWTIYWLRDALS